MQGTDYIVADHMEMEEGLVVVDVEEGYRLLSAMLANGFITDRFRFVPTGTRFTHMTHRQPCVPRTFNILSCKRYLFLEWQWKYKI